jgi:hypothetical protein
MSDESAASANGNRRALIGDMTPADRSSDQIVEVVMASGRSSERK